MKKLRPQEIDTVLRLINLADSPQNLDAMQYMVFQFDFKDYNQFIIECPPGSIRFTNFLRTAVFCDNLGYLVEAGIVPEEPTFELFPVLWARMEPIIRGMRQDVGWPDLFDLFQRLGQRYEKWRDAKYKRLKITLPPAEPPKAPARPVLRPAGSMPAKPSTAAARMASVNRAGGESVGVPGAVRQPGLPARPAAVGTAAALPARPAAPAVAPARPAPAKPAVATTTATVTPAPARPEKSAPAQPSKAAPARPDAKVKDRPSGAAARRR